MMSVALEEFCSMFIPSGALVTAVKTLQSHVPFAKARQIDVSETTSAGEVAAEEQGISVKVGDVKLAMQLRRMGRWSDGS